MTIQTSWEVMQQYREELSVAKDAKALYAGELKKLRLTVEYLRSLQHWITVASGEKTLNARKLALTEFMGTNTTMERETAARSVCYWDWVPANCRANIRNAISWARTATRSPTLKDWQECCDNAGDCIGDAVCQVEVVRSRVRSSWMQARANMITARIVIDTCAKDILPPVAIPKAVRKEMVRKLMNTVINDSRAPIRRNISLYFFANLVHTKARKRAYGFTVTYSIWNRALAIRAMYPR